MGQILHSGRALGVPLILTTDTRYVADFVGTSNFFDGLITTTGAGRASLKTTSGETLEGLASPRIQSSGKGCISVRPERIRLSAEAGADRLEVIVQNRIFLGEHTEYLVHHASFGSIIVLTPRQAELGSRQSELDDYLQRYQRDGSYDRFFFICHSPSGPLHAPEAPHLHLWTGERLADVVLDVGLFDWLMDRTR
jgi:ABC-type Fe3+/spermidine/putrescine transport system ATPase subunit